MCVCVCLFFTNLEITSTAMPSGESVFSENDRIRIVSDAVVECGGYGASEHHPDVVDEVTDLP